MTEKIYEKKPYQQTLQAKVLAVSPSTRKKPGAPEKQGKASGSAAQNSQAGKDLWEIELDKTICYPEGGGQPGDTGKLDNLLLLDTRKEGDTILHVVEGIPSFSVGDTVTVELDWAHRFDYMQQHTGQHLISGAMYRTFGIGTVAVHQGEEITTIEIDRDAISDEELRAIEDVVAEDIAKNMSVVCEVYSEDEVHALDLRREPKVSGYIRLVMIGDADIAACGGVHTQTTGEVQAVFCVGIEKIRGRIRTVWKIGQRARDDYRSCLGIVKEFGTRLSSPPEKLVEALEAKLLSYQEALRDIQTCEQLLAERMIQSAVEQACTVTAGKVVVLLLEQSRNGLLKRCIDALPDAEPMAFCGVQRLAQGGLQWAIAAKGEFPLDFSRIKAELFPVIAAKGGGKPPVWQGKGDSEAAAEAFLDGFVKLLKE